MPPPVVDTETSTVSLPSSMATWLPANDDANV